MRQVDINFAISFSSLNVPSVFKAHFPSNGAISPITCQVQETLMMFTVSSLHVRLEISSGFGGLSERLNGHWSQRKKSLSANCSPLCIFPLQRFWPLLKQI